MFTDHSVRRLAPVVLVLLLLSGSGHLDRPAGDSRSIKVRVGDVELLYPGKLRTIPMQIGNPFDFDIVVTKITVSSKGTPSCGPQFLDLGSYPVDGPVIRANARRAASTRIALTHAAPGTCQGERFAIRVTVNVGRA